MADDYPNPQGEQPSTTTTSLPTDNTPIQAEPTNDIPQQIDGEALFDEENFNAVQAIVARKATQADELQAQIKELNESLKNILINDAQLAEVEEQAKEARKNIQKRKGELNNSQEALSIKAKLQELKDELKDIEESLSTQLLNLYQLTGVQEFETDSGEVREFVIKARVKSKKK